MFVGVGRLVLHLPANNSLKGKRRVVRSLVDRTKAKFNASVAEVGDNDALRKATLGFCVIGNESSHVDSMLSRVCSFIEWLGLAQVLSIETEIIPLGGEIGQGPRMHEPPALWNDDDDTEEEEW